MQKVITAFLLCFVLACSFGQKQKFIALYLMTQYNNTIYDITKGNNPWGIGLGGQAFLNNKTKFKPTIEITGDIYLVNDKVFRMNSSGKELVDVRGMVNLFAGISFNPVNNFYLSLVGGPAFISSQTLLGIKPCVGFYFPKSKKWTGKVSYINIFDRDRETRQDFGSFNLAIGFKLF
jgi:hypothetical protein